MQEMDDYKAAVQTVKDSVAHLKDAKERLKIALDKNVNDIGAQIATDTALPK